MQRKLIIWIYFGIILSLPVSAVYLSPGWYWSHQKIISVDEIIIVTKSALYVELEAEILIDKFIHNESDWVTFRFSPAFSKFDVIGNYEDFVALRTRGIGSHSAYDYNENATYTRKERNNSWYEYNVSVASFPGWNTIIFKANFTLENEVFKTGDYRYSFFYISDIDTNNHDLFFKIPNQFEVKDITVPGTKKYRSTYLLFSPTSEYVDQPIYFSLEDIDEKKALELREKKINYTINFLFLIIGAGLSLGFTIIYDKLRQQKWKPIKEKALKLVESKLWNLSSCVLKLFKGTSSVVNLPNEATQIEILKSFDKKRIKIIKEWMKKTENELSQEINHEFIKGMDETLEKGYYALFNKFQDDIHNLELKYRFVLEKGILMVLIELEEELYSLSINLKTKNWAGVVHNSKQILMEINKAINLGVIKK